MSFPLMKIFFTTEVRAEPHKVSHRVVYDARVLAVRRAPRQEMAIVGKPPRCPPIGRGAGRILELTSCKGHVALPDVPQDLGAIRRHEGPGHLAGPQNLHPALVVRLADHLHHVVELWPGDLLQKPPGFPMVLQILDGVSHGFTPCPT